MKKLLLLILGITVQFAYSQGDTYYGAGMDVYTYAGQPVILYGSSASTYSWSPSAGLSYDTIAQPVVTVTVTTPFVLQYTRYGDPTFYYDTTFVYVVNPPDASSISSCTNVVNNAYMESGSHVNAWNSLPTAWGNPPGSEGTADYYSTLMSPGGSPLGIPGEFYGAPATSSGTGFAGITIQGPSNLAVEYLQQNLPCSLLVGQPYTVSFNAAWAGLCNYDCGTIGALLTTNQLSPPPAASGSYILGTPQVSGSCLNNSNWQTFSGTVTGAGQKYITIGNFNAPGGCATIANNGINYNVNYNYVDNVIINPIAPTVTASQTVVCQGQPLTLQETGSPAASCTWYDPTGVNLGTGSPLGFYATTSGIYTVSVNLGCSTCTALTNTINIVVTPNTPLTVTGPSTVCPGSIINLSTSGGTSYTWTPGNHFGPSTYSFTIFTPGVYTYTVVSNNCGKGTQTFTVNPAPNISINVNPYTNCPGATSTLTASGSTTYTWNTGATTPVILVSPTVNTTYTVSSVGTNGCIASKTAVVDITPNTCTGTAPSYNISSSGIYNPAIGFIAQNMYIGNGTNAPSYTISSANVTIAPNAYIEVAKNATLTVTGSWLHVCSPCGGNMWDGIIVQNGGKVIVTNYSIIEDADTAIYTAPLSSGSTYPTWNISSSIFNKNGIALYADANLGGNYSSNYIYNTISTCRSLSSHNVTATNFNAIKTDVAAATPLHPSTTNPTTLTLAGARSKYGVYLSNISPAGSVAIGNSAQGSNLFDNMDYAVYAVGSPTTIKNNTFQNLTGNSNGVQTGVGVWISVGYDGGITNSVIGNSSVSINNAEKNNFSNCLRGVIASNSESIFINNNTFSNETTASTFTVPGSYVTGEYAVFNAGFAATSSPASPYEQLQFANNTVTNYATGYYLDFNSLYNTNAGSMGGSGYFYNNTITSATTTASPNNYCNTGIYLQQNSGSGAGSGVPITAIEITNNTITNISTNCIYVLNVGNSSTTAGFVDIQTNTELSIKPNAYTTIPFPRIAAVSLSNSWYVRVCDNSYIHTTGYTGIQVPPGQFMAGIYVTQSPRSDVNCNTITNMGECFVWESTSPSYSMISRWQRNNLDYSKYGLVLRNTGVMGDQGNSSYPISTLWGTNSHFTAQTLADASNPGAGATSKLYERNTNCTTTPCSNIYSLSNGGTPYSSTTLLNATGSTTLPCVSDAGGGTGGSGRLENPSNNADAVNQDSLQATLLAMLNNTSIMPAYDFETRWALRNHIHGIMPNLAIPVSATYQNAISFADVDAKIGAADYSGAQALLNTITPKNIIEQNWLTVDNVLIKMQSSTLNSSDLSALQTVANQCHLTGGSIVWRARGLLNHYYKIILNFPDVCQPAKTSSTGREAAGIETIDNSQSVSFYPNPNNGNMTFEYTLTSNAQLRISDVAGREIAIYRLNAVEKTTEINIEGILNGVYLYTVINEQGLLKTGRIVIMK
jgi:hypothetical protein